MKRRKTTTTDRTTHYPELWPGPGGKRTVCGIRGPLPRYRLGSGQAGDDLTCAACRAGAGTLGRVR